MKSTAYTTAYLLVLISLGFMSSDMYLPSLPALSVYFEASDHQVQMTLFTFLFSFSLSPLVFGPLSDHLGRRKVILAGLAIAFISTLGCIFAPNIQTVTFFRFIQGIGVAAVMICGRATTSDLFTGEAFRKQIALTTACMPLILAVAPTIGGILQEQFGWKATFTFLASYMALIFVWVAFSSETLTKKTQTKLSEIFSTYRNPLSNKLFIAYSINFILPAFGMFGYLTVSPFLFQEVIGLSPIEYGSLALYVGGTIIVTGFINLLFIHRFSSTSIVRLGSIFMGLAGCLLLFFHLQGILTTWSLLLPALIYFTSLPLCVANAASKAYSFLNGHFGAAVALLTTFQFLLGAISTFVFSHLSDRSILPLAITFMAVGLLSVINLAIAQRLELSKES